MHSGLVGEQQLVDIVNSGDFSALQELDIGSQNKTLSTIVHMGEQGKIQKEDLATMQQDLIQPDLLQQTPIEDYLGIMANPITRSALLELNGHPRNATIILDKISESTQLGEFNRSTMNSALDRLSENGLVVTTYYGWKSTSGKFYTLTPRGKTAKYLSAAFSKHDMENKPLLYEIFFSPGFANPCKTELRYWFLKNIKRPYSQLRMERKTVGKNSKYLEKIGVINIGREGQYKTTSLTNKGNNLMNLINSLESALERPFFRETLREVSQPLLRKKDILHANNVVIFESYQKQGHRYRN